MTSYQEITRKVGDQWVAALKRAEDSIMKATENLDDVRGKVDLPDFPAPAALTKLNEAFSERLPKPSEVVEANFELTSRVLAAQRDLTLRLLEVSGRGAGRKPAAKAAAKKTAKKTAKKV
jgi:hypothetical protein